MTGFRQLPVWWVRDEVGLKRFTGGKSSGGSIAALKCLLGIVLSDFSNQAIKVSYTDLEAITGLSRPMVIKAVRKLEGERIVAVDRGGNRNVYQLVYSSSDMGWAKVPYDRLKQSLCRFPNRGDASLSALKIYIYILALRPNPTRDVKITHETLRDRTGLQKNRIRPGIDLLINHILIHVHRVEEVIIRGKEQRGNNVYTILGDLRMP